jgi:hypothetical protein
MPVLCPIELRKGQRTLEVMNSRAEYGSFLIPCCAVKYFTLSKSRSECWKEKHKWPFLSFSGWRRYSFQKKKFLRW